MSTQLNGTTKTVNFPPLSTEEAAKITGLLTSMGEFMDFQYEIKEVKILAVEFDGEREDVASVLGKIAAAKKVKRASPVTKKA